MFLLVHFIPLPFALCKKDRKSEKIGAVNALQRQLSARLRQVGRMISLRDGDEDQSHFHLISVRQSGERGQKRLRLATRRTPVIHEGLDAVLNVWSGRTSPGMASSCGLIVLIFDIGHSLLPNSPIPGPAQVRPHRTGRE